MLLPKRWPRERKPFGNPNRCLYPRGCFRGGRSFFAPAFFSSVGPETIRVPAGDDSAWPSRDRRRLFLLGRSTKRFIIRSEWRTALNTLSNSIALLKHRHAQFRLAGLRLP